MQFGAESFQFLQLIRLQFREGHFEAFDCVDDDPGGDEASVGFVVGGNDVPGAIFGGSFAENVFVGGHVLFPEFPFGEVAGVELPVLFGIIEAFEEPAFLFVAGDVQEEFEDASAVVVEVAFVIADGAEA